MNMFAISTCSLKGWNEYGRRMVESFVQHWPSDIKLVVYTEGFDLPQAPNLIAASFPTWFTRWKERHAGAADPNGRDRTRNRRLREYDYRRDCVKFAHKVAAMSDATDGADEDLAIWLDADIVTHAPVDHAWLRRLFPDYAPQSMAWLDRRSVYPECGFMMFKRAGRDALMSQFRALYESDEVFRLSETHDSYVLEHLVRERVRQGAMVEPYSLSGPVARLSHHPFVLSPLGERLDHAKGKRKQQGRTPPAEVAGRRGEPYWRR